MLKPPDDQMISMGNSPISTPGENRLSQFSLCKQHDSGRKSTNI